jgi:hypothetical protein
MDTIDILFVVLLITLLITKKKTSLLTWGIFLMLGYVIVKYFKPVERLTQQEKSTRLAQIEADISYLKTVGLTETSNNDTMKRLVQERRSLNSSAVDSPSSRLAKVNGDIAYLKSVGLTEKSDNETMKRLVAERNELEKSVVPPPNTTPLRDTPVTPSAPLLPPVPAMKCSIENFGSI